MQSKRTEKITTSRNRKSHNSLPSVALSTSRSRNKFLLNLCAINVSFFSFLSVISGRSSAGKWRFVFLWLMRVSVGLSGSIRTWSDDGVQCLWNGVLTGPLEEIPLVRGSTTTDFNLVGLSREWIVVWRIHRMYANGIAKSERVSVRVQMSPQPSDHLWRRSGHLSSGVVEKRWYEEVLLGPEKGVLRSGHPTWWSCPTPWPSSQATN